MRFNNSPPVPILSNESRGGFDDLAQLDNVWMVHFDHGASPEIIHLSEIVCDSFGLEMFHGIILTTILVHSLVHPPPNASAEWILAIDFILIREVIIRLLPTKLQIFDQPLTLGVVIGGDGGSSGILPGLRLTCVLPHLSLQFPISKSVLPKLTQRTNGWLQ